MINILSLFWVLVLIGYFGLHIIVAFFMFYAINVGLHFIDAIAEKLISKISNINKKRVV
ncbi:hypothetical protein [Clostridium celatum]|uniref:Uncharacterized protein n=1 Tax=Clostridium celatum DSM 1785 TaxID=545697 RepID=L1QF42_9CLOT|nr:hypothetical protein [Clostridium celatum]EKY26566.1 hypothetical protein HMPREF0216_01751 [Clostridium celatum DSM 1785]